MSRDDDHVLTLRRLWGAEPGELQDLDYTLFAEIDGAYVVRSRAGLLVLPVEGERPNRVEPPRTNLS